MIPIELRGTEIMTIELSGSIAPGDAERLVGPRGLALDLDQEGRARVGVLLFDMRGLALRGLPQIGLDYGEALWRVGVSRAGAPAWFGVACDLDHPWVRRLGALFVRYPVREALFTFDQRDGLWTATASARDGVLSVEARASTDEAPVVPPKPLYVAAGPDLYRIPWREDPAPYRRFADVTIEGALGGETLGPSLVWDARALLHRGRVHRCGVAQRVFG